MAEQRGPNAKTGAQRQSEYQQRHPERERAKAARFREAGRILRDRYRLEYELAIDSRLPTPKRYREALRIVREAHPDEWRKILDATT